MAEDSPLHSSSTSSDDFAAFLDDELDVASDVPLEEEVEEEDDDSGNDEDDDDFDSDLERIKRRKIECGKTSSEELIMPADMENQPHASGALLGNDVCTHPGTIGGLCIRCGQRLNDEEKESGVAFAYIHRDLRLADEEIARMRDKDIKKIFRDKKLYLVLDLDHTLLNSTLLSHITEEERYLTVKDNLPEPLNSSLHRVDRIRMMTKLRPFVHSFLKEASKLFEMYIYTMGERPYALEMANLLDPQGIYFNSRVISQGDSTKKYQKDLDIVVGQESAVLILDDTEAVWGKHKENVIVMERYHFFASSCRQFGFNCKSLSQQRSDENEMDGTLASVLKVLQEIHSCFYNQEHTGSLVNRDVRQLLKSARREVLKGCKVVFSHIFPSGYPAEEHRLWKMAEQLGAVCCMKVDPSVTHVVALDAGTEKSRWAVKEEKFLVDPKWIEAANYLWRRMPEANYPVFQQPKQQQQ